MEFQKYENGESQDNKSYDYDFIISEAPATVVIDASVCIKWFSSLKEENVDQAIKLRSDFFYRRIYIIAPDLLIYEVTNALSYNPKFNSGHVVEALSSLNSMQIKIIKPIPQVLEIAVNIRYKKNISIYDSVYMALSRFINAQFVTADKKLYEKVKDLGNTIFLADYI
ncbi:MAG: type II toxin-antitoxin system VapC family toxin [Actinobacteria bacterium]|nr:type II toxin-antitoxin system VapC family toxin [Actinomycetota bacterium]